MPHTVHPLHGARAHSDAMKDNTVKDRRETEKIPLFQKRWRVRGHRGEAAGPKPTREEKVDKDGHEHEHERERECRGSLVHMVNSDRGCKYKYKCRNKSIATRTFVGA